jgi:hypothetical protein
MPALRSLIIGDTAAAWKMGGFEVIHRHGRARTTIGEVDVELVGPDDGRGILGWRFDDADLPDSIDGITTLVAIDPASTIEQDAPTHTNLANHVDHVVMMTPDLARTIEALERAGFEARRVRDIPGSEPARQQVFFWAGSSIIELVGPVDPTGDGPATLWGLALSCSDLDAAHQAMGERLGQPKAAVQTGRRIATLRTRDLDISTPIALLSPHLAEGGDDGA